MIGKGALLQRVDDGGAIRRFGAFDGIGQHPHGGVGHEDLVAEEQALGLHALLEFRAALVFRVEPVVAVDDAVGSLRKFLDELVAGSGTTQHRVDRFRRYLLLLHGAHQQRVFVVVIGRNHDVGVDRLHAQHDVVEVARRIGVLDDFLDLVAITGKFARQQVGGAGAEQRFLVDDHHRARRFAGSGVEHVQVRHRHFGALAVAGAKAEGVFQAALDNLVRHTDVHHMRQVVLGCGLGRGQTDGGGKGTDHG